MTEQLNAFLPGQGMPSNDDAADRYPMAVEDIPAESTDNVTQNSDYFVEKDGLRFAGVHLLLDMVGAGNLTDKDLIETVLHEAAAAAGATTLHCHLHQFGNGGISGVLVLAESHISIHTWPEHEFAALDIFMCGQCDPYKAIEKLREAFTPDSIQLNEHKRGLSL